MTDEMEFGPIDYLVVEWPVDAEPTGEAFPLLLDLIDRGLVRILDLAFVHKEADGTIVTLDLGDLHLESHPEFAAFEGASSGLLGADDYDEVGVVLQTGSTAAILVFENTWAAPFATALRRGGAQLVATGRIPVAALIEALDVAEAAETQA
jgi:hypothetical protein